MIVRALMRPKKARGYVEGGDAVVVAVAMVVGRSGIACGKRRKYVMQVMIYPARSVFAAYVCKHAAWCHRHLN